MIARTQRVNAATPLAPSTRLSFPPLQHGVGAPLLPGPHSQAGWWFSSGGSVESACSDACLHEPAGPFVTTA